MTQPELQPVILDVAVLIRGLLSRQGACGAIFQALRERRFVNLSCRQQLAELYRVLGYRRIQKRCGVTESVRRRIVSQFYARSVLLRFSPGPPICRDPNDDYLIYLALSAGPCCLVTTDDDLLDDAAVRLALAEHDVNLMEPAQFLQLLR